MISASRKFKDNLDQIINGLILLGMLLVVGGVFSITSTSREQKAPVLEFKTSLTARDAAVESAKRNGRTDYQFESNFTPGLGVIDNPNEYRREWRESRLEP